MELSKVRRCIGRIERIVSHHVLSPVLFAIFFVRLIGRIQVFQILLFENSRQNIRAKRYQCRQKGWVDITYE